MALVVLTGYPSSGKTTRAKEIQSFLERKIATSSKELAFSSVAIVNDGSVGLSKSSYSTTTKEKAARGALYSAIQRSLGPRQAVIVDALNYIKGFRYQIYCLGRELGFRQVTVHVAVPARDCKEWNAGRDAAERYSDQTMDELIYRYEEPDAFNRWEAPLVVLPKDDGPGITGYAADEIWKAVTEATLRPPNQATVSTTVAQTDQLQLMEATTSAIVNAVSARLRTEPEVSAMTVRLGQSDLLVELPATTQKHPPSMVALQRIKRQFIQMQRTAHVSGASLSIDRQQLSSKAVEGQAPSVNSSFRKAPTKSAIVESRPQGFVDGLNETTIAQNFIHYLMSCLAVG